MSGRSTVGAAVDRGILDRMAAFRDDHAEAVRFGQHVAVAEGELERIEAIPRRIEISGALAQEALDALVYEFRQCWERAWDHLQQARAIVAAKGRDTSAFDRARAEAGDLWGNVASGKSTTLYRDVYISWKSVGTRTARDAIAALRAAMPEVVVAQQAPLDVDLTPSSIKVFRAIQTLAGFAVLAGIAYLVYRIATS